MSQHIAPLRRYRATGEINYRVDDAAATLERVKDEFAKRNATFDELDGLTVTLGDITEGGWWFNLRSSNTEPLLRLNLEAGDEKSRDEHLKEVQSVLGAQPVAGH